jgi:hypothetical protein
LRGGVEEEGIFFWEGGGAGGCGVGSEVLLRESYGDGGISWQIQFWVAFSPVSVTVSRNWKRGRGGGVVLDDCDVDWCRGAGLVDFCVSHFDLDSLFWIYQRIWRVEVTPEEAN